MHADQPLSRPAPSRAPRLSIGALLGIFFGVAALMLVGFAAELTARAWSRHAQASQVALGAEAVRELFATGSTMRLERGETLTMLSAPAPDPERTRILPRRVAVRQSFGPAMALLRELGDAATAERLEAAWREIEALRERVDAASRLPREGRDAALAPRWAGVTNDFAEAVLAATDAVEDRLMLRSPLIDQLVALRRDGWTARSHFGNLALLASTALAAGRVPAPPAMIAAQQEIGRMRLAWAQVKAAAALPGMPAELAALVGRLDAVLTGPLAQEREAVLAELMAGRLPAVDHDAFRSRQVPPIAQMAELPTAVAEAMVAQARGELAAARLGLGLGAALLLAALAIGLGGILATRRLVARPVTELTEAMRRLAGGDLDIAVPAVGRGREMTAMAVALAVFKDGLVEARRLEALRAAEQAEKLRRAEALDALARGFEAQMEAAMRGLAAAAEGLEAGAGSMTASAEEGRRQAGAIASAAHDANGGVQGVAAASEQLAASIAEIARQVGQSQQIVQAAVAEAERTDGVVRALSEGAGRITEVVTLIRQIAGQTNLLALNATIEAARAGEAGKGFAVVAGEVKALAAQTAKATEEIGAQISAIQGATAEAVAAIRGIALTVGQVSELSAAIAGAVEQQDSATREISSSVQAVAAGTSAVTDGIGALSGLADRTGQAAEKVAGATEEVTRQTVTARGEVGRFLAAVKAA